MKSDGISEWMKGNGQTQTRFDFNFYNHPCYDWENAPIWIWFDMKLSRMPSTSLGFDYVLGTEGQKINHMRSKFIMTFIRLVFGLLLVGEI